MVQKHAQPSLKEVNPIKLNKLKFSKTIYQLANIVEGAIASCMIIFTSYLIIQMAIEYGNQAISGKSFVFGLFLARAIDLVIGIELTKMLCRHSPDTVIDVLMFATARQAVLDHTRIMENLLAVFAIGILFLIRKYIISSDTKTTSKKEHTFFQRFIDPWTTRRAGPEQTVPEPRSDVGITE